MGTLCFRAKLNSLTLRSSSLTRAVHVSEPLAEESWLCVLLHFSYPFVQPRTPELLQLYEVID